MVKDATVTYSTRVVLGPYPIVGEVDEEAFYAATVDIQREREKVQTERILRPYYAIRGMMLIIAWLQ